MSILNNPAEIFKKNPFMLDTLRNHLIANGDHFGLKIAPYLIVSISPKEFEIKSDKSVATDRLTDTLNTATAHDRRREYLAMEIDRIEEQLFNAQNDRGEIFMNADFQLMDLTARANHYVEAIQYATSDDARAKFYEEYTLAAIGYDKIFAMAQEKMRQSDVTIRTLNSRKEVCLRQQNILFSINSIKNNRKKHTYTVILDY